MTTPTPSDAAMTPEEVNAFIEAITSNPDAQILLTQDGQGKMLKVAALIRLCGECAKQSAAPLREELAQANDEIIRLQRRVANTFSEKDGVAVLNRCRDERDTLRASNDKLRAALEEIASQKTNEEIDADHNALTDDYGVHDFEEGYDKCVKTARAALAPERKETT